MNIPYIKSFFAWSFSKMIIILNVEHHTQTPADGNNCKTANGEKPICLVNTPMKDCYLIVAKDFKEPT